MSVESTITAEQIRDAVAAIKKSRPAYAQILDFYEKIFIARIESEERIKIDPVTFSEEMLRIKKKEKLPLMDPSDFPLDMEESENLLRQLCMISKDSNPVLSISAQKILEGMEKKRIDPALLFQAVIKGDDSTFASISEELEIEKKVVSFMAYHGISPSLLACARQLSVYTDKEEEWGKGYCPICGNPPGMSGLEKEGRRVLYCGFCLHEWDLPRIMCPFCENRKADTLHYFFSEEEAEYRVYVCEKCKKYIKTIDKGKLSRPLYPPLEQVSTIHLDMMAAEKGFESAV